MIEGHSQQEQDLRKQYEEQLKQAEEDKVAELVLYVAVMDRNRTLFLSICSCVSDFKPSELCMPTKVTKGKLCSNFNLSSKHTTTLGL